MTSEITKIGVIDVDYRRIECRYGLRNLTVKVAEQSKFPDYLAVVVMYQAGAFDLRGVNVFDWASGDWRTMARGEGAVFEIRDAPTAEAKRMIYLGLEFNPVMRLESFFHVADIPATWKVGHAYGSSYQLPVHEPP
ncbi:Expansin-like A3 [Linum perenne]